MFQNVWYIFRNENAKMYDVQYILKTSPAKCSEIGSFTPAILCSHFEGPHTFWKQVLEELDEVFSFFFSLSQDQTLNIMVTATLDQPPDDESFGF